MKAFRNQKSSLGIPLSPEVSMVRRAPNDSCAKSWPTLTRPSDKRDGQAMVLAVLLMGGMLMMMTAISGLLMFYQVRQSGEAGISAVAIFAADAGLERLGYFNNWVQYEQSLCYTQVPNNLPRPCDSSPLFGEPFTSWLQSPPGFFTNGATYQATLLFPPTGSGDSVTLTAVGKDETGQATRVIQKSYR